MKTLIVLIQFAIIFISITSAQFNNIRVSTDPYNQSETAIAINSTNSNIVLAAWNDYRLINGNDSFKPGYAFSTDAGQSWSDNIHLPPNYINGFDPSVAFDRNNISYYCYIATIIDMGAVYISKTTNLGIDWDDDKVSTASTWQDKPWVTIDNTGGSRDGRIYFTWTDFSEFSRIKFRYSTDHGNNFSDEQTLAEINEYPGDWAWSIPRDPDYEPEYLYSVVTSSMPVVDQNGNLYVIWAMGEPVSGQGTIFIKKSTDGGDVFGEQIAVVDVTVLKGGGPPLPFITVDQSNGNMYISYTSKVGENYRLKFTKSTNGGNSWSSPLTLGTGEFFMEDQSSISVDKSGKITIFYRSYQNKYITESFDEGNSFLAPIKITDQPSVYGGHVGHYQGLVNTKSGFSNCIWTDSRDPNVDVYFSPANSLNYYASQNKTVNYSSTGNNGQRKITRDENGHYHFIFSSGGNIYYRKSSDLGLTWSTSLNISTEGGRNDFPSITMKGNYLFVTYRESNGIENNQYKYTLRGKWKLINEENWYSMSIDNPFVYLNSQTADPFPVAIAATNVDNNYNSLQDAPELMIAFTNNNGINHVNLFYTYTQGETPEYNFNQLGSIHQIPNTTSGFQNPSIAVNSTGTIMLSSDFNGNIYAFYTTGGNWTSISSSLFSLTNVIANTKSSITTDGTGYFHISWQGENTRYESSSILHRKLSFIGGIGGKITEFTNAQYFSTQPSTFGHMDANGGVSIYWHTTDDLDVKKVIHNGSSWNYLWNNFIPSIQTDARYVNSIDKDLPDNFAYSWTSTGELPVSFNVDINDDIPDGNLSLEGSPMSIGDDSTKTYRSAELNVTNLDALLELQLGNFNLIDKNGISTPLDLQQIPSDYVVTSFNEVINTLWCDSIPRSKLLRKISFDYSTTFKNLHRIKANNSNNVSIKFKLIDRETGNTLYTSNAFIFPLDSTRRTESGCLIIPLNGLNQRYDISVKLILEGVDNIYLNQTENINLVDTYLTGGSLLGKQNKFKTVSAQLTEYSLDQNYPNPFNPSTKIKYSVPVTSNVVIQIFDILGRKIETLVNEVKPAGVYETNWNAENLPSGIYFYQIQAGSFIDTKKMILLK